MSKSVNAPALYATLPGIALCLAIAALAWSLGSILPVIGSAVFAIASGITIGALQKGERFKPGIRFAGKKLLQYSIILLGFDMQLSRVVAVGGQSLFVMLFTLSAAFIAAAAMGKALKLSGNVGILIGVGTAICGGSAIAAAAPVLRAKDEEIAQAISTIFLFNVAAVFIFPPLGSLLGLSDQGFGIWAGTAVNDTSSVVAAASAWSQRGGDDAALATATIVKLTRTLMIIPVCLALAWHTTRKSVAGSHGISVAGATTSAAQGFSLARTFPWFVLGFLAAALANSFAPLPAPLPALLARAGKFLIVMAMSAIGLSTNLKKLLAGGRKPLALGLVCWFTVAAVSLAVQAAVGRW
ncbi:MAG TPA: putative sulfate exporter family transporter [Spirochaetaceae bacterium]|nr:putative sulfate exporter family transporter [Spirochaetaceae bacterium]